MFIESIPQGHCVIVTRFGKPVGVRKSGLQFFIPFIDQLFDVSGVWGDETNKKGVFVELSEQRTNAKARTCYTKDNVEVNVDTCIRWRITDPIKAVFEVDHLHPTLIDTVLSEVRSAVGNRTLDEIISQRAAFSDSIIQNVIKTTTRWGIAVLGLEVQEINVDDATKDAMLQQMNAERQRRATIMLADAEKDAMIKKAQGRKEALRLHAEAERSYVGMLAEVIGADAAAKVLLARQTLEGYSTIAADPAAKVYLPSDVHAIIASLDK